QVVGPALVRIPDARQIAWRTHRRGRDAIAAARHVDGPARQGALDLPLVAMDAAGLAHEREGIGLRQADVHLDAIAVIEGIRHVEGRHALRTLEPADLTGLAIARHHAHPALQ